MLNCAFTGFVYDNNSNKLSNIYYQMCYYSSVSNDFIWKSTIKQTDMDGYYSSNLGDGDWLTQNYSIHNNDKILIVVWDGSLDRSILNQFATIEIVIDGVASVYKQNLMIIAPQLPLCSFTIPEYVYVDNILNVVSHASADYLWDFQGIVHKHISNWYGEPIFNNVGILKVEYLYEPSNTSFIIQSSYIYNNPGNYIITQKVTTKLNKVCELSKDIDVIYKIDCGFTWLPENPYIGDDVIFTPNIIGNTSLVNNVSYFIDGENIFMSANPSRIFNHMFNSIKSYLIKQVITYDNGIEIVNSEITKTLTMSIRSPICNLLKSIDANNVITVINNATAGDGMIIEYRWEIYFDNPNIESIGADFTLVYSKDWNPSNQLIISLIHIGDYYIKGFVKNSFGLISQCEVVQTITCKECDDCPDCPDCPDCSDLEYYIKTFTVSEQNIYEFMLSLDMNYLFDYTDIVEYVFNNTVVTNYIFEYTINVNYVFDIES